MIVDTASAPQYKIPSKKFHEIKHQVSRILKISSQREDSSKTHCQNCRKMYCTDKSSDTSTIVLEEHLQSYCQCPQLEQQNPTRFSSNNRTDLVERFTDNMEWESSIKQTNRHSSGNRCISNRMGSSLSEQHSIRGMGQRNVSQTKQYQRTDGSIDVNHDIQKRIEQQNSSTSIRQHDNSSMHQQIDGYQPGPSHDHTCNIQSNSTTPDYIDCQTSIRNNEHSGRFSQQNSRSLRLGAISNSISSIGSNLGTTHNRQDGILEEQKDNEIQLQSKRPRSRSNRCIQSGVDRGKQLHQSTISTSSTNNSTTQERQSNSNNNCTNLASSTMVSTADRDDDRQANDNRPEELFSNRTLTDGGTTEKSEMEDCSIQSIWKDQLQEWPEEIQETILSAFKKSTRRSYDNFANRFATFCNSLGKSWKEATSVEIAKFMMEIAKNKDRPKSSLDQALASIAAMFEFANKPSPTQSTIVSRLRKGLINQTTEPVQKGGAMAPEPLIELFRKWGQNEQLSIEQLRMKAMSLIAFIGMYRPSDLALPTLENIQFKQDLSAVTFCLLGFKNDYNANGAEVTIVSSADPILCPVKALKLYLEKIESFRNGERHLFIANKKPYGALSAQRCSKLLQKTAELAGLDPQLFTGRTFRRGGATTAINNNVNPDIVMTMGRWKSPQTFYGHYVRARTEDNYTDKVLGTQLSNSSDNQTSTTSTHSTL